MDSSSLGIIESSVEIEFDSVIATDISISFVVDGGGVSIFFGFFKTYSNFGVLA